MKTVLLNLRTTLIACLVFNRRALYIASLLVLPTFNVMAENVMDDFAVVINIKGIEPGKLKLTGETLANIYLGKITKWDDPEITTYNNDVTLPDLSITVVHRSDFNRKDPTKDTTFKFSKYLSKTSADWKTKVGEITNGSEIIWPTGMVGKGNDGVASTVARVNGSIGYVGFDYAYENKMAYALLKNHKDQKPIDPYVGFDKRKAEQAALADRRAREEERQFGMLGVCEIGSTVYHRERWNTTTSSGNAIADIAFGAATKEQFLIEFEAVVEGFLGNKVKVLINDYRVQQTKGGGFLSRKTYQGESLGLYADKYLGKTQYYLRSRCSK